VADREGGEVGGFVPEDLRGRLAPVVALQERGEVVGCTADREPVLGGQLRGGRLGGAAEEVTLLVTGGFECGELGQ
jgi:hypothetical protein